MIYTPLKCVTHYSVLNSLIKPTKLAERLKTDGFSACALTDLTSISGAVDFSQELKKNKIKPILGTQFSITSPNGFITCIAKNKKGWDHLIRLTSKSNDLDRINKERPTLYLPDLEGVTDLLCLVGSYGSILANNIDGYEEILSCLKDMFGKDNIFLEVQRVNKDELELSDRVREIGQKTDIKCVATINPHYLDETQYIDHKLLLCSQLKTTSSQLIIKANGKFNQFIGSDGNHLIHPDKITEYNSLEEIENTNLVNALCEDYSITGRPRTPKFECPDNLSEIDFLRKLAREGYGRLKQNNWDSKVYGDRAKLELDTIERVGLAGYFLIVQDYVNWAKQQGYLVGPARGSSAGSIIAYFTGITTVDPIVYDLLWERFYNEGRNSENKVSFPDIDVDFPITHREKVAEYLSEKYGKERVGHIVTYGRMQGRGALKEVLRVHGACDMATMNKITQNLPQEHEIADRLEEEKQESIIRWTLENEPEAISDYCQLSDNGVMMGEYAQFFEQAARLEGTFRSQGKHAAGTIVSAEKLADICPMIADKNSNEKLVGFEMESAEAIGCLKFDILGVAALDKLSYVNQLLKV